MENTFLTPLVNVLAIARIDRSKFFKELYSVDNKALTQLSIICEKLYKYGDFYTLIPAVVYFRYECTMGKMPHADEWLQTQAFFTKIVHIVKAYETALRDKHIDIGVGLSVAHMEELLWQTLETQAIQYDKAGINCCISLPGMLQENLSSKFLKSLENDTFPLLFGALSKFTGAQPYDQMDYSILTNALAVYSSELGWRYYNFLNQISNKIFSMPAESLTGLGYKKFKEMCLGHTSHIELDISITWVQQLEKMCVFAERFEINDFYSKTLNSALPMLYHFAGCTEYASEKLFAIMNKLTIREKTEGVIMLAAYRTLLAEQPDTASRIASQYFLIPEYAHDDLIKTFEDIISFYSSFSEELAGRFNQNELRSAMEYDEVFYSIYDYYIKNNIAPNSTDDMLYSIWWVYENLFNNNNKVIDNFEFLLTKIQDSNIFLYDRVFYIYKFSGLFSYLADVDNPHREERMSLSAYIEAIGEDFMNIPEATRPDYEVFSIYNSQQIKALRALHRRLIKNMESVPMRSPGLYRVPETSNLVLKKHQNYMANNPIINLSVERLILQVENESKGLNQNDIIEIKQHLESIREELNNESHDNDKIQKALTALKYIKGSAEFASAVVSLIAFISKIGI